MVLFGSVVKRILPLRNTVQDYAWGSPTWIPELLGAESPAPRPQAELWMGAHPQAPSRALIDGREVPLLELIEDHPLEILGADVLRRFGPRLPFLLKILAAARPLSIQAHPDLEQARAGFRREEALGIPRDDPRRSYRDDNHKPECLCALGEFWALCGFRPPARSAALLELLLPAAEGSLLDPLRRGDLRLFFRDLMDLETGRRAAILDAALAAAAALSAAGGPHAEACTWIEELHRHYPGDIGILAPAFLNLVRLRPGQAIALPARQLHAYLRGLGVELMASSDNVLRGGLTPKHVDLPELMRVLRFEARPARILEPEARSSGEAVYVGDADELELAHLSIGADRPHRAPPEHGVEILFCSAGRGTLRQGETTLEIDRGDSFLVPAAAGGYRIEGEATLYRARVLPSPG